MASKCTIVQIVKYNLNSATQTIRQNRTKMVSYQFAKQTISKLKQSTAIVSLLNKISKPRTGTILLLLQQFLTKGFPFIDWDNTVQKIYISTITTKHTKQLLNS